MIFIFNTSRAYPRMHVCTNLVILTPICVELSRGQAKITKILSQHCQNDLEIRVNDHHFQYQPRVSKDTSFVQFVDSSSNLGRVIVRTMQSLRSDGRTDRRRQRHYPFSLKGQWVKILFGPLCAYLVSYNAHNRTCPNLRHKEHFLSKEINNILSYGVDILVRTDERTDVGDENTPAVFMSEGD